MADHIHVHVFYGWFVTQVAIDVCKGSDVRPRQQQSWKTSESSAGGAATRLHKTKCKVKHNHTTILVLEGDITSYRCDVIVNAANADYSTLAVLPWRYAKQVSL